MRAVVLLALTACGRFGFARTATDDATPSSVDSTSAVSDVGRDTPLAIASLAFVQSAANKGDGTTRTDTAFTSAVTAGDLLVVETDYNDSTLPTITDDLASTWHQLAPFDGNGGFNRNVVAWTIAPSTGNDTVHATIPRTTVFFELRVHEYTGAGRFDTQVGATGTTPPCRAAITTTVANELVYVVTIFNNDTTPSAGPTFTQRTAYAEDYTGDAMFATPGTYNADTIFTGTPPINWTTTVVSFIPQ